MWCHNQLKRAEVGSALKRVYFGCFQLLREKRYFWRFIFLSINLICLSVVSFGREFPHRNYSSFQRKGRNIHLLLFMLWGCYFRHKLPINIDRFDLSGDALKKYLHIVKRLSLVHLICGFGPH